MKTHTPKKPKGAMVGKRALSRLSNTPFLFYEAMGKYQFCIPRKMMGGRLNHPPKWA